jgi:hypothetical protein
MYKRVETQPGLDQFAGDRAGLERRALGPLLQWARAVVPRGARASTPLFIAATAGLRRLPEGVRQDLLADVQRVAGAPPPRAPAPATADLRHCATAPLRRCCPAPLLLRCCASGLSVIQQHPAPPAATAAGSGFLFRPNWARTISGAQEGMYGWVALNYAQGLLDEPRALEEQLAGAGAVAGEQGGAGAAAGRGSAAAAAVAAGGKVGARAADGAGEGGAGGVKYRGHRGAHQITMGSLDLGGSSLEVRGALLRLLLLPLRLRLLLPLRLRAWDLLLPRGRVAARGPEDDVGTACRAATWPRCCTCCCHPALAEALLLKSAPALRCRS